MSRMIVRSAGVLAATAAMALVSSGALAGEKTSDMSGAAKDAWLQGKLETVYMLNRHLNPFSIDTEVKNGTAYLSGTVESEIDKSLAEELAKGIEGIHDVESNLKVDAAAPKREVPASMRTNDDGNRSFSQWVDDSTTTAAVKSAFIAESEVKARHIDVDTSYDVVTLTGTVGSSEEKQLAEEIARNTSDVRSVNNRLTVGSQ